MAKSDVGRAKPPAGGNLKGAARKAAPGAKESAARGVSVHSKRYSDAEQQRLWDLVIEELKSGKTLNKSIAAVEGAPSAAEFLRWVDEADARPKQYADSRLIGYAKMADEILDIGDTPIYGDTTVFNGDGEVITVTRAEMRDHRRIQIDNRKWLLSKALPKLYGDRTVIATESGDALAAALLSIAERLPV